jgi:hypothetical protein
VPLCRQDLPEEQAGWPSQLFAVITAVFGLASFALVLALIEQVGWAAVGTLLRDAMRCDAMRYGAACNWPFRRQS